MGLLLPIAQDTVDRPSLRLGVVLGLRLIF
jgi:hypothetical protein